MTSDEAIKHISQASIEELREVLDHPDLPGFWRHTIKGMIFMKTYGSTPESLAKYLTKPKEPMVTIDVEAIGCG